MILDGVIYNMTRITNKQAAIRLRYWGVKNKKEDLHYFNNELREVNI